MSKRTKDASLPAPPQRPEEEQEGLDVSEDVRTQAVFLLGKLKGRMDVCSMHVPILVLDQATHSGRTRIVVFYTDLL